MRRAVEHHVLEQMREAGVARLVARADAHPHLERDDRRRAVFERQHAEPVVEARRCAARGGIVEPGPALAARAEREREQPRTEAGRAQTRTGLAHGALRYRRVPEVSSMRQRRRAARAAAARAQRSPCSAIEGRRGRRCLPTCRATCSARLSHRPRQSEARDGAGRAREGEARRDRTAASIWSNVFRAAQHVPAHVDEILALSPRPLARLAPARHPPRRVRRAARGRRHRRGAGPLPDGRAPAPASAASRARAASAIALDRLRDRQGPHVPALRTRGRAVRVPREPARAARRRHRARAPRDRRGAAARRSPRSRACRCPKPRCASSRASSSAAAAAAARRRTA